MPKGMNQSVFNESRLRIIANINIVLCQIQPLFDFLVGVVLSPLMASTKSPLVVSGIQHQVPDSYRVVVDGDPIVRIPGTLIDYEHVGKLLQFDGEGAQLAPDGIQSNGLFQLFDFPKHVLKSYYASLRELQSSCDSSNSLDSDSCLNVGWLVTAADAERESSRKAWQVVPKESIPWENIPLDQVTIEKIPVDKLPTEFPDLKMPPWTKMAPVSKIFVDNVPIDEIPLDSLVDKLELEDTPLDDLLSDFSVDKLPVGKLPLD